MAVVCNRTTFLWVYYFIPFISPVQSLLILFRYRRRVHLKIDVSQGRMMWCSIVTLGVDCNWMATADKRHVRLCCFSRSIPSNKPVCFHPSFSLPARKKSLPWPSNIKHLIPRYWKEILLNPLTPKLHIKVLQILPSGGSSLVKSIIFRWFPPFSFNI